MIGPPPLGSIEKILVRGVNWIGDTILTLPSIEALRNLLPRAHITLLVKDHLSSLFRNAPWVDEVLACPRASAGMRSLEEEIHLVRNLRRGGYNCALVFPRSPRSALTPYLAGIRYRIGYAAHGRGLLLTHRIRETQALRTSHQADYYYELVKFMGVSAGRPLPRLCIGSEEDALAQSFYDATGIASQHRVIALNPGSTYGPAKCWPPGRYIELARRLLASPRNRLLLVGGSDNAGLVEYIYLSLNRRALKAVGKDLMLLAAILKRCDLMITNDTGPMHMASAVGIPVIALFGPTDPLTTSPLGPHNRLMRKQTDCSPCLKRICPHNHRCMEAITVDEVEAAAYEHMTCSSGNPPQCVTAVS